MDKFLDTLHLTFELYHFYQSQKRPDASGLMMDFSGCRFRRSRNTDQETFIHGLGIPDRPYRTATAEFACPFDSSSK